MEFGSQATLSSLPGGEQQSLGRLLCPDREWAQHPGRHHIFICLNSMGPDTTNPKFSPHCGQIKSSPQLHIDMKDSEPQGLFVIIIRFLFVFICLLSGNSVLFIWFGLLFVCSLDLFVCFVFSRKGTCFPELCMCSIRSRGP